MLNEMNRKDIKIGLKMNTSDVQLTKYSSLFLICLFPYVWFFIFFNDI